MGDTKSTEIILCPFCSGHGCTTESELEDYHRGEYRYWSAPCKRCGGSGRMYKTTSVTYHAFKEDK